MANILKYGSNLCSSSVKMTDEGNEYDINIIVCYTELV